MVSRKKIRFIEPQGRPGRPFNAWISRWPLLGPITLASVLEQRGYDVAVYNESISGSVLDHPEAMEDVLSADVVGISIMTPTASRGYAIADALKAARPSVHIVFGGVHATFKSEEALAHGDLVVQGEGEEVIERIASGEITEGIVRGDPPEDLDVLPPLNHSLMVDFDKLLSRFRRRELYELPVMTSRGCPYGCQYCTVTQMFGRKVRRQSVEKVHSDLKHYAGQGFKRLFFYDDNFTTHRRWSHDLLGRMNGMGLRFNAQVRVDFPWKGGKRREKDEKLLEAMRDAGGDVLYIGYETIDDATAEDWNKGYTGAGPLAQRLLEDTRTLHDYGFWIHGMFVLGPDQDEQAARNIVNFARKGQLESLQISILTPLPGTPLMGQMAPQLVLDDYPGDWDYYDGTHCVYRHGKMGLEDLQRTVLDSHRQFYRFGGWSMRRLRCLVNQRVPLIDKLAMLWQNARTARATLRAWEEETRAFIETVRDRAARKQSAASQEP